MTVEQQVAIRSWPPDIGVDWDYEDGQRVIMHADCRGVLGALPTDSINLVVTDPPYGMAFMGKDWDKVLPDPIIWRECLRVLKPGAFAFVMSSPRADLLSRMIASLEGAGFNVGFLLIYWAYACLSADTEVLTEDGWKDWEQLRMSTIRDRIVVYDTEAEIFQFESPSAWHAYAVREDLLRIESGDTEQLVTRNHRVLTPRGMVYADHLADEANVVYLPQVPAHIRCVPGRGSQETQQCGALLLSPLPRGGDDPGADSQWQARPSDVRGAEATATRIHDGRQESGLEGRSHVLQDTRELRRRQVRQMPVGISGDGPQGRLRDGASLAGSAATGQAATADGGRPSQEPRSGRQQSGRDALRWQPEPQAVRSGASYRTTLARVYRQWFDGVVYCPTVSTGCFVARRNGKIFLTGNSGFPKAQNIGKVIDKRNGRSQDTYKPFADYLKAKRKVMGYSMAQMDNSLGTNTAYSWWEGRASGVQLPTKVYYLQLKEILNLDDRFDELIEREEAEREVLGERLAPDGKPYSERQPTQWTPQFSDNAVVGAPPPMLTAPATPQAQALDGSYAGFQPKPAVEVIIVAMKPLSEKTYVDQALANGHGVTWLDAGRIPYQSDDDKSSARPQGKATSKVGALAGKTQNDRVRTEFQVTQTGRFPANLLCSDDVLDDGHKDKGTKPHPVTSRAGPVEGYGSVTQRSGQVVNYGDSGSFSRYFDLDAWWAERIKSLPESVQRTFPFLEVTKASKREKNAGLDLSQSVVLGHNRFDKCATCGGYMFQNEDRPSACKCDSPVRAPNTVSGNHHPTVKPLKLMSYLIELGSRLGDVVLDPFVGSGPTLLSAGAADRYSIGIERDESAYDIASSRCAAAAVERIRRGEY